MEDDVGEPTEEAEETESERAVLFVESILVVVVVIFVIVLFEGDVVVYMVWVFVVTQDLYSSFYFKVCLNLAMEEERERGIIYNHATSHWSSASSSIITI